MNSSLLRRLCAEYTKLASSIGRRAHDNPTYREAIAALDKSATGEDLRDQGILAALSNAERVTPGWSEEALGYVRVFATTRHEFTVEQVREFAYESGLPRPPDDRAWGHIPITAVKRGWVERAGVVEAVDPKVHKNMVTLWRSRIGAK